VETDEEGRDVGKRDGQGGRIVLVATPIGNLGDLSPRAAAALADADVVAAEDTRRTGRLLAHLELRRPLLRYDDHTEQGRTTDLLDRAAAGETVVVATDAGTPAISDPGYSLVRAAAERGVPVELVPGPVAAVHALVLSGLPTDRFAFDGFLPRRAAQRRARIAALVDEDRTVVLYLSPHRAADELADLAAGLGARRAALARELTKLHEEVLRLPLPALAERVAADGIRGELTLVIGGRPPQEHGAVDDETLVERVRALIATGVARNTAIADVARAAGVPRGRVYDAVVVAGR
jgi:16S rRNA (cytidine1402-2'-O)-methyltransferase